ncbi:MAG TPA: class D sortase [Thermoanaerobaculia bacterium]|nr:class D sortase [Thermoanaerobaculia bacterium]
MTSRTAEPHRPLRLLRRLSWGVAVLCLGTWGWAQIDAARFEAAAELELERAMAGSSSAASREAAALEQAVDRELGELAETADAPPSDDRPVGDGIDRLPPDDGLRAAAQPADTAAPAARPATTVGATEVLGRLRIPRIDLSVVIAEGVDRRTLRRAAGRIPGTATLGGRGNVGIAGHRDGVFRDLSRAASGDLVIVETPDGAVHYRIEAISIVGPEATDVLAATGHPTLTLITCYPFDLLGPAEERWVVRARRVEPTAI